MFDFLFNGGFMFILIIAGIAVEHGYTVDEFKKTVFPHPTVGEVIHESLYL
jgi:dihydrolipoamide dehydrogenase